MTGDSGTHAYLDDPRNAEILISINGELYPRDEAKVSVFESGYMLGDGVWEGIRLHKGRLVFLDQHLARLYEGAKAIDMDIGLTPTEMEARLYATLAANTMDDGVSAMCCSNTRRRIRTSRCCDRRRRASCAMRRDPAPTP